MVDESDLHKGHAGARPEGETHFRVRIAARRFAASRVEAHRMVNAALADEFARGLHALAIEAKAPASGWIQGQVLGSRLWGVSDGCWVPSPGEPATPNPRPGCIPIADPRATSRCASSQRI